MKQRRGVTLLPTRKRMFVWLAVLLGVAALAVVAWLALVRMPGRSHRGPLPPLDEATRALAGELERDVRRLAVEIGERNVLHAKGLDAAARHVESELAACGLPPQRQTYDCGTARVSNVWADVAGGARAAELVVIGAHYDSVEGTTGANDNASGVAAMLAIARRLAASRPLRTLRFVAFVNEEPPHFQGDAMGSAVFARAAHARGDDVVAMLSLETLGCYSDEPGSQSYPAPGLSLVYPTRGDFVAFVGNVASRTLVRRAIASFRGAAAFPSEGAALPGAIPGVGWSDHWAFWQQGYAAVMVTDTAPFRFREYHTVSDVPERIDFARLARVTAGLVAVVSELASPSE